MSDLEDQANVKLTPETDDEPSPGIGPQNGPPTVPSLLCSNCTRKGSTNQPVYVIPTGRGQCPTCGCFLPMNDAAIKHPDKLRPLAHTLEEDLKTLRMQFPPSNYLEERIIERLAKVMHDLDTHTDPGDASWKRLAEVETALRATLYDAQPRKPTTEASLDNLTAEQLTASCLQLLDTVIEIPGANLTLVRERLTKVLDTLPVIEQFRQAIAATPQPTQYETAIHEPAPVAAKPTPPVEPKCHYCQRSTSDCTQFYTDKVDDWLFCHTYDFGERAKAAKKDQDQRRRDATLSGWRTLGIQRPEY
jgi:hypothetical protein